MSIEELSNKGIDSFVNNFVSFISKKAPEFCITQYKKHEMKLNKGLPEYIKANYQRCAFVRTLLKRDRPTELDKIYESLQFKIDDEILKEDEIKSSIATDLHRTIISGYAGNGKTIFLKKIYKELIDNQVNFYPIFFELRNISSGTQTLLDCIYKSIVTYSDSFTQEQFTYGLKKGLFYFLIDGLDEVSDLQQNNIQEEIIKLTLKYPYCPFVVTSRPNEFTTWENFHVAHLLPFDYRQCQSFIKKIDYVEERKTDFLEFLTEDKFEEHEEFLSNPLLASMMLLTFDEYGDIPAKRHIFYEKCFQVLIKEHDASKGRFHRPLKSKLSHENLEKVFMYFCAISYQDQNYGFSLKEVDEYIDLSLQILNLDKICRENDIRYDFVHSVSLLLQDGNYFEFIHRSFQEYFFAKFIVNDREFELENKLDNIDGLFSLEKSSFIAMIDDMDHDYFETEYILKKLKVLNEYFESIDAENEPEKIFNKFTKTIIMARSQKKDKFILMIFAPFDRYKDKEMLINSFILRKSKNFINYANKLYIDLSSNKVLKIHNEYNNFNIKLSMDEDKTILNVVFDSNRELLIEFNCTECAQYIKKSLNYYYHDILSRTTKQRSIIDEIIFKNRKL
ncbi:putative NTPase (NACHT family) [Snodgrassella alvi SCGC AB-598-J21]|uniref:Putative NTPase (NACHT family) n=1 Tax=Snodgrassella alvi SCGC AB-598-J21 TaxID=1385367 RepID=A0A074W0S0_9NEIS|nr:NACHT domain-containing protein [Snodgrassella alvi]KEQ01069.1 putative NTPase (NACHT family) [Snodgrassella alvi SCGC AB-598-J21]